MNIKCFIILYLLVANILFSNSDKKINGDVEKYISDLKDSSTGKLMQLVRDGRKNMKRAAIKRLGDLKSKEAIDILICVMTYGWAPERFDKKYMAGKKKLVPELDEDVRAEAALSLGKLKDPENIPLIGNTIMVDRNSKVKQYCLKALGLIRKKECVEYIVKAIKYELSLNKNKVDNNVVKTAMEALGDIGHKDGFIILIEVTQNEKLEYDTKKAALKTLEKIRWE